PPPSPIDPSMRIGLTAGSGIVIALPSESLEHRDSCRFFDPFPGLGVDSVAAAVDDGDGLALGCRVAYQVGSVEEAGPYDCGQLLRVAFHRSGEAVGDRVE